MVYETCPRQYYQTFVRRLPPPVTAAMRRGTNIHALIAGHLHQPSLLPPDLEPRMRPLWSNFLASRFNRTPLAVETAFTLPFDGANVCGRMDAMYADDREGLEVVDFKSGRPWTPEAAQSVLQLPLYALAARWERGLPAEVVIGSYFFLRGPEEASVRPTADDEMRLVERVDRLIAGILRGDFAATPGCTCFACRRDDK